MGEGILAWDNRFEQGTLFTGSQLLSAPVSNLLIPQGSEPWVTVVGVKTSADGAYIMVDMGSAATFQAFGIFRTNLSLTATVRYKLGTTALAGDVMDTGPLDGVLSRINQHVYVHSEELSARYLTIEIEDFGNPDNQIYVGLAFGGPLFQPNFNFDYTSASGREHRLERAESAGGQSYSRAYWQRRLWSLSWGSILQDEMYESLEELDFYARTGRNVLFVPEPNSSIRYRNAIFGEMSDMTPFTFAQAGLDIRAWKAAIKERL